MSVLVKGKMPEKCFQCVAYDIGTTSCLLFSNGIPARYRLSAREKPDWCELVELPPHGRLIDADALEQDAQKRLLICNKYDDQFQKPYEVMRAIALAPTIIPAEEGE